MLAYIPVAFLEGKRLLAGERFDVINTHFALPTGPVGNALARLAGVPNILTVHGGDLYDPSKFTSPHRHPLLKAWVRRLLLAADVVVGQSNNTLANMHRFYTPEIKGLHIPLGIQRPGRLQVSRRAYGFTDEDVLLITVGRLVARKAVHQLISVMGALENKNTHLLIVGSGPEEKALRREVLRRGLAERVHFMGYVEEAHKFGLLEASDIYVSTSQHEGFCLSFLEAMTSRLPIVCYDYGGHTDYLRDGVSGFVVPLNDRAAFIERCRQLIASALLRRELGRNNRSKVEDYYVDSCAGRYERVFSRLVEARRLQNKEASLVESPSISRK
jgi:glycosyltransferase involved in cell wall biosynthesis